MAASRRWIHLMCLAACMASSAVAAPVTITGVSGDPVAFDPGPGERGTIVYRLSSAARVTVRVWDASDRLVRTLIAGQERATGEHREIWDGRDDSGRVVAPEAYPFTIEALGPGESTPVVHDMTDADHGEDAPLENVTLDAATGAISYSLAGPSRVVLRISEAEGPLIRTVVNFAVRTATTATEPWDGWDAGRATFYPPQRRSLLRANGSGHRLSRNTFVITGTGSAPEPTGAARRPRAQGTHRMYQHSQHPRHACFDPQITLSLAGGAGSAGHDDEGFTVQVGAPASAERFILDQRFELVFYVDGVFSYEEELGFLPFNWTWKPAGLSGTEHVITANLLGYEGHFGTVSLKLPIPSRPGTTVP